MKTQHTLYFASMLLALLLCSACTGVNEKQLTLDPVISETEKISQFVGQQRTEYEALKKAYLANPKPEYLVRMQLVMALVRDELDRADYLQKNTRYYGKGLDYQRWQSANETHRLNRTTLCEMMVDVGKLHMDHGDKQYAMELLTTVVTSFDDEQTQLSVEQAREYLAVLGKNDFIAATKPRERKDIEN